MLHCRPHAWKCDILATDLPAGTRIRLTSGLTMWCGRQSLVSGVTASRAMLSKFEASPLLCACAATSCDLTPCNHRQATSIGPTHIALDTVNGFQQRVFVRDSHCHHCLDPSAKRTMSAFQPSQPSIPTSTTIEIATPAKPGTSSQDAIRHHVREPLHRRSASATAVFEPDRAGHAWARAIGLLADPPFLPCSCRRCGNCTHQGSLT